MMETTVVHFSGMQVMLMIALCAIAVLVPVWAIRRIARAVPPVYQVSGIPSGVGGLLLFTIVLLIVEAVNALYHFGRAAGEAARVISMSTDYLWPVAQTLIPDFAASFFLLIAIGALVFGRSSVALGAAVVCAWLGGPLVAVLRTIYLGLPIELAGGRDPLSSLLQSSRTYLRHRLGPQACALARRLRRRGALMKPVIGSLMLLLVFLMVIHSFWKWSRQFPPAHEREPSGVEGGLIVLVGFMAAAVLFNATGFGLMVSAVMGAVPEGFWIRTGLPGILSFAGIVWAMLRLLSGRTPSVRLEASLGCLASGPVAEAWMLQAGTGDVSRLAVSVVLTAGAVLYLYLSPRSKHTYG